MIVGVTGHRKFGYFGNKKVESFVHSAILKILNELKPEALISGFALGTDQIAVKAALESKIGVIAAVPFIGQESIWNEESKREYKNLLDQASKVEVVSPGGYAGWKMHKRNQWIVDNCDQLIAVLDPNVRAGGTFLCAEYAANKDKKIHYINPYA